MLVVRKENNRKTNLSRDPRAQKRMPLKTKTTVRKEVLCCAAYETFNCVQLPILIHTQLTGSYIDLRLEKR